MHAVDSFPLITLLSQPLVRLVGVEDLIRNFTDSYWSLSKCREQRWNTGLNQLAPRLKSSVRLDGSWTEFCQISEEVLLSEMMTRIWLAKAIHNSHQADDIVAIARFVGTEHAKARIKTLQMLRYVPQADKQSDFFSASVLQMHKHVARGTDMYLAHMIGNSVAIDQAFDRKVFLDVTRQAQSQEPDTLVFARQKIGENLSATFTANTTGTAFTPDLNLRIAECISTCLSSELAIA